MTPDKTNTPLEAWIALDDDGTFVYILFDGPPTARPDLHWHHVKSVTSPAPSPQGAVENGILILKGLLPSVQNAVLEEVVKLILTAPTPSETLTAPVGKCGCVVPGGYMEETVCRKCGLPTDGRFKSISPATPKGSEPPARPDIEINMPDGKVQVYGFAGQINDAPDFFDRVAASVRVMVETGMIRFRAEPQPLPDTLEGTP